MFSSIQRRSLLQYLAAAGAGLLLPSTAFAQATLDEERTRILRALAPDGVSTQAATKASGSRRAVAADDGGAKVTVQVDTARSVDLAVYFGFDSDVVGPDGARTLLPLGGALRDPRLAGVRVLIAGHTDAQGRLGYNVNLSSRRARAVREHMAIVHGVDPQRMLAHGYGPTRLKVPERPLDPANRRVEIALVVA